MGNNNSKKNNTIRNPIFNKYEIVEKSPYVLNYNNDEINRLTEQHYISKYIFNNKNFIVPIDNLLEEYNKNNNNDFNVLDIGCSNGVWCLDMANIFENINFYGIDINKEFPDFIKGRTNCKFEIGNIIKGIPFDKTFDFIHQRLLVAGIPEKEWGNIIKNSKERLKKYGWIELVEWDLDPIDAGDNFRELMDYGFNVLEDNKINPSIAREIKEILKKENFENIKEEIYNVPINWNGKRDIEKNMDYVRDIMDEDKKEIIGGIYKFEDEFYVESDLIGKIYTNDWKDIFQNLKEKIKNKMKIKLNNNDDKYINNYFNKLLIDSINECKNKKTYFKWYIIYGQMN